jgi:nitrile hydratase accessory protein
MKQAKLEDLLAGTPLEKDVTFSAPWEARAFAMAVRLSEAGAFSWDEFRNHLTAEIGKADKVRAHGWIEDGDGYYTYFLRALENLLREKSIIDESALEMKMSEIGATDHDDHDHDDHGHDH